MTSPRVSPKPTVNWTGRRPKLPTQVFTVYVQRELHRDGSIKREIILRLRCEEAYDGWWPFEVTPKTRGADWLELTKIQKSMRVPMLRTLNRAIEQTDVLSARMCATLYRHEVPTGWYKTLLSFNVEMQPWPVMRYAQLQLCDDGSMAQLRSWHDDRARLKLDGPVAARAHREPWTGWLAQIGDQYDDQVSAVLRQTLNRLDGVKI